MKAKNKQKSSSSHWKIEILRADDESKVGYRCTSSMSMTPSFFEAVPWRFSLFIISFGLSLSLSLSLYLILDLKPTHAQEMNALVFKTSEGIYIYSLYLDDFRYSVMLQRMKETVISMLPQYKGYRW